MSPSTTGIVPGFLSTPSGWRATPAGDRCVAKGYISIHALRVEGDKRENGSADRGNISIHALRVEGDVALVPQAFTVRDFYPRPPGGGRHGPVGGGAEADDFYPRPPGGGRR